MSTNSGWRYSINTFESNTRGTNIKMLSLSTDTHAKLKNEESNPAIAAILLLYEPVFFAYRDICEQYGIKSGEYEGTTLGFEQYLDQMPVRLKQWEGIIRAIYNEDTPQEKAIFPNKRVPFESGTYEKRLEALGALKGKTAADPALAAANTLITSFYNAALGARLVQQMSEGAVDQLSALRETQRLILADELVGVLAQLMFIHKHDLKQTERYFDLSLLRDTGEETIIINGTAGPNSVVNLNGLIDAEVEDITPSTTIIMKNKSTEPVTISFYFSMVPAAPPGASTQYILAPGEELEKTYEEIAVPGMEFFNVQNASSSQAIWEIEIIL